MGNLYADRISALRELMSRNGWDAVVISGSDPHSSEYPAPRWKQVEWLTGFTGEAGDVVITEDHAGLWTDSRYFIQAVDQLEGTGVELHKTRIPGAVYIPEWLAGKARVVAVDGLCQSVSAVAELREALGSDAVVVDVPDLLDALWEGRPWMPVTPVTTLDVDCFGGVSRSEKIGWLRKWMLVNGYDKVLLSSLDEVAWLLNVRGSDIEYNPLVISYLLVSQDYVKWYVRKPSAVDYVDPDTEDSFAELRNDGVSVEDYDAVCIGLADFGDDEHSGVIFIDPSTLNYHIADCIGSAFLPSCIVKGTSPVILEKSVKTASEIEHLRQTFIDDGVAMECFLHWLDEEVSSGREVTEWEASERLTAFRAEIPGYRGNSFENISAYGPSAALPHYSTPCEGSSVIRPRGLYLVDSGGQYLTGTTDITRTVPMGECTQLEKEDYTLVLKGMIDLSMAAFPRGTTGHQLDALARMPLWRAGRNFGHGTGHGVGYYLCVHEGPQSIRFQYNPQPLLPGMVTSNEPALYREGVHGIRHENIILCREAGVTEFGDWLDFETLTLCHFDTAAVLPELLGPEAVAWLNAYNDRVYRTLAPHLPPRTAAWLRDKTLAI
ncbi:MAG: aminopeptidase P family protein [Bacteroidales bacterium]|nr:aminopeptidase P family protein [Bacteroidales bacterium]